MSVGGNIKEHQHLSLSLFLSCQQTPRAIRQESQYLTGVLSITHKLNTLQQTKSSKGSLFRLLPVWLSSSSSSYSCQSSRPLCTNFAPIDRLAVIWLPLLWTGQGRLPCHPRSQKRTDGGSFPAVLQNKRKKAVVKLLQKKWVAFAQLFVVPSGNGQLGEGRKRGQAREDSATSHAKQNTAAAIRGN